MRSIFNKVCRLLAFAAISFADVSYAENMPASADAVLLTISGEITNRNVGDTLQLDLAMLENLPQVEIVTSTIWTEGVDTYKGVLLRDLLDHAGHAGISISATAINDYAVDVPIESATEKWPIVAYERNGGPMSVRDKGPLWLIYPFDDYDELRSEIIYSRSIWQLDRIVVTD